MADTTLGKAYIEILPSEQGLRGAISDLMGGEAEQAGKSSGLKLASALKGAIAAAGIGTAVKAALDEGAKLQQSYGGLDTIYGDAADAAKAYAAEAVQAGISANDYAEQAVSMGASLKQAFGGDTAKAAEAANTAIMDMADNAAKMGTPIDQIQSAYQGFAKGQYQLLDNLKLGYGGTKSEMERLLADATELTGVEYDINNLGDVYDAIHAIQGDLGLTGVAAAEAGTTFSGSFDAMKAAAQNLLGNLALGEDIGPSLQALGTTVSNFAFNNLFPMIGNIISQVPKLLGGLLTTALQNIPNLVSSVTGVINQMANAFSGNSGAVSGALGQIGKVAMEAFRNTDWAGLGSAVIRLLGNGIQLLAQNIPNILRTIGTAGINLFKSIDWAGLGRTVIQFIGNGIRALMQNIPSVLRSIGQNAMSAFRSIDWGSLGRNIISGIVNGVANAAGSLFSSLQNLASDALSSAKNFLQIGSPSRVFADQVGQWIPAGIAEGIENNTDLITEAMGPATDASIGGFAYQAGPVAPAAAGANISNVFNIYQQPGQDNRELAEYVMEIMTQREQEIAAVWG